MGRHGRLGVERRGHERSGADGSGMARAGMVGRGRDSIGLAVKAWSGSDWVHRTGWETQARTARSLRTGRERCGRLGMGRTRWARVGRRGQDGIGQNENGWERQARLGDERRGTDGCGRLGRRRWEWDDWTGVAGKARVSEEQLAATGMGAARNGSRGWHVGDGRTLARTGRLRPGLTGWGAARQSSRGLEHRGLVGRITDWQGRLGVSWPGTVWRGAAGWARNGAAAVTPWCGAE